MDLPESVSACHDLIRRLQEENTALRRSGATFGYLAERLNRQLQDERRRGERRRTARSEDDRRDTPVAAGHAAPKISR